MKNILEVINILTIEFEAPKVERLAKEFVIKINDRGPLYTEKLGQLIKKYVGINSRVVNSLRYGDYVVFVKNDVYTDKNDDRVLDLDLPIYKMTNDYNKIEKLINNFFKNVYVKKQAFDICDYCPFSKKAKQQPTIFRDGQYVNIKEKVSIFHTYVKVGYDIYEIDVRRGHKFVDIEGDLFEVKSDYRGFYLELV